MKYPISIWIKIYKIKRQEKKNDKLIRKAEQMLKRIEKDNPCD